MDLAFPTQYGRDCFAQILKDSSYIIWKSSEIIIDIVRRLNTLLLFHRPGFMTAHNLAQNALEKAAAV